MKKRIPFLMLLLIALAATGATPKYVFYFIGDGMGPTHVLSTEMYLGELNGQIGRPYRICFTEFPQTAFVTTFSASNGVTDSAASGTALATGHKTNNGFLGMTPDGTKVNSIAAMAKSAGYAVGISTTVPINHATPGAFYAHQSSRNNYRQIAEELISSKYDFFAGGDPIYDEERREELYKAYTEEGYSIVRGYDNIDKKSLDADKLILLQKEVATQIPYTIDRTVNDLTLAHITKTGIDFLSKKSDKGFFFMIEGGKIDYASHSDDVATMMQEVLDFEKAVQLAVEFYNQHPDETLIVVTADHETGGLVLGFNSSYTLNLKALQGQKVSTDRLKEILIATDSKQPLTWEAVTEILRENMGLWETVSVNKKEEEQLRNIYNEATNAPNSNKRKNFLKHLANYAKETVARSAAISWASGNHSGTFVPLFAIGTGSNIFHGIIDNTDVPKLIKSVAGY